MNFWLYVALAQFTHLVSTTLHQIHKSVTIFTDSQATRNVLKYQRPIPSQKLHPQIPPVEISGNRVQTTMVTWSPGNIQAHSLAQLATLPSSVPLSLTNPVLLRSMAKQRAHTQGPAPGPNALFMKAKVGRFIKSFDKALPGKHTNTIYQRSTR